jgi:hypothetical protein
MFTYKENTISEANEESLAQPKVTDGIEFYVSTDGKESGMSIAGLARFIGMPETTYRVVGGF